MSAPKLQLKTSGLAALGAVLLPALLVIASTHAIHWAIDATWSERVGIRLQTDTSANIGRDELRSFTPSQLCADSNRPDSMAGFCERFDQFLALEWIAAAIAGVGLLALLLVAFAGRISGSSARKLRFFFPMALFGTRLMCMGISIAYGVLFLSTIYLTEVLFGNESQVYLLGVTSFLFGIVVFRNALGAWSEYRQVPFKIPSLSIPLGENPKLNTFLNGVFGTMGMELPKNILVGVDSLLFVTELPVKGIQETVKGLTLFLPLPLMRLMNEKELQTILAHELVHLQGADKKLTDQFLRPFEGVLQEIEEPNTRFHRMISFPTRSAMLFLLSAFRPSQQTVSRERELDADRLVAEKFGKELLARALLKFYAFNATWNYVEDEMRGFLAEGKSITNASEFFATANTIPETDFFLSHLALCTLDHPVDHHPLLGERLGILNFTVQQLAESTLSKRARQDLAGSAASLIEDYALLEQGLTDVNHLRNPNQVSRASHNPTLYEPVSVAEPEDSEREIA